MSDMASTVLPGSMMRAAIGAPMQPGMMNTQYQGPPTGLIGSEQALQGGAQGALSALLGGYNQAQGVLNDPRGSTYNMGGVSGAVGQGVAGLNPFVQPGGQAMSLQAALSGAMGAPAQQQAYSNFQESPGQAYLRQQSEQALLRNQAAIGGLGGGRVRQELQRQATGLAAQDFDNAFARLGGLSTLGANAAGQQANLFGQQAGIAGNLEGQAMSNTNARQLALAGYASGTGNNAADLAFRTGQSVSQGRTQAGRDIASAVGGTTSALANLANQGGADVAATIGQGAGNLANVINSAGTGQAASQANLANLLAEILRAQGNQAAGLPGIPGVSQVDGALKGIGAAASGGAALLATPMLASDIRLKENIQYVGRAPSGVSVYTWDWNEDGQSVTGETSGFGVIAQEVMETHPEAVIQGEDGWLRVNYGALNV